MNKQTAIVPGSISAVAQREGGSIAETFSNASVIILADSSGSMGARDSRDRQSRYDVLLQELATLQAKMQGEIAVLNFSDAAKWTPGGQPEFLGGGTNLASALRFAKIADTAERRFIIISDGVPDDEQAALEVASTYQSKINTVYVGPENGYGSSGKAFLERLAAASGGQSATADRVVKLAATVETLLLTGGKA